jgi:beta-galactosidase/beta-glucuronidase
LLEHEYTPRPEYPRPQFVRSRWLSLNGEWEFAFDDGDAGLKLGWQFGLPLPAKIVVPFAYQTNLSGINDKSLHEILWYARTFEVPHAWASENLLLHFGAVDYASTIWINGHEAGRNEGGHVPFFLNIAPYLNPGPNRITVRVHDSQSGEQPRGKQSISGLPHDIEYYCTSGIWQTVWLEPVPPMRIEELKIQPLVGLRAFEIKAYLHAPCATWKVEVEAYDGETRVNAVSVECSSATIQLHVKIPSAKLWSPESPHLYTFKLRLYGDGELLDEVSTYAGLRAIELRERACYLNGEPVYLKMVLDQGYWPDGNLTAPTDAALREDVEWIKRFGFNGVRKHQKIEDPRWLYWCDRLGLLVWAEMPNTREWSARAERRIAAEWERVLQRDYNHPCIIAWVPINESWGLPGLTENPAQYAFLEHMVALTRRWDSLRPVIDNDGWEHSDVTDICAIHDYTPSASLLRDRYSDAIAGGELPSHVWIGDRPLFTLGSRYRGQPVVLSEVGGFLEVPRDMPATERDMLFSFYGSWRDQPEFLAKFRDLMEGIASLSFVCGYCYTQLTDIEQETNGLLTYDRRAKVDPGKIREIQDQLFITRAPLESE